MTSQAEDSFGTMLKIGDGGGPETFATIAELLDIGGPELSADTTEVTNHSSTGGFEEFIATILRTGSVSFDVNFVPQDATHGYSTGLIKDLVNRTKRNFQLVMTDAGTTTWQFAALVTKFAPNFPVNGPRRASITLKITGQPTLM